MLWVTTRVRGGCSDYAQRDGRRCAFYLRTTDVTPRPLNSVNNPVPPDDGTGMPRKNRLWTKLGPNHQRNEGADRRHFLDINADTVDELLDGLIVTRRRFCGGHPDGAAYDPGPNNFQPHRDVVITHTAAEVELVESPTFVILDLSSGVVVKGYEHTVVVGVPALYCRIRYTRQCPFSPHSLSLY